MVVSQTIKMAHRGSTMSKIVPLLVRWIPPFPKCHPSLNADDPPALDAHLRRLLLGIKVIGQDGGWSSLLPAHFQTLPSISLTLFPAFPAHSLTLSQTSLLASPPGIPLTRPPPPPSAPCSTNSDARRVPEFPPFPRPGMGSPARTFGLFCLSRSSFARKAARCSAVMSLAYGFCW